MDETQELDFDNMSKEELLNYLGDDYVDPNAPTQNQTEQQQVTEPVTPEVSTEPTAEPGKFDHIEPGEIIPGTWGLRKPRPGVGGFLQDTGQRMYESAAPLVGIADTAIDFVNFASAGDDWDIPKLPTYEDKTSQAVRNISGLVIPSLGLRSMMVQGASKIHAAGKAAPWAQKLGNRQSFQAFSKFGLDVFSGGLVDYVAEQNQKDDNFLGTLKKYWPKTYKWIPDRYATTD